MTWHLIDDPDNQPPKDGTEFQAWLVNDDGEHIGWEPRCMFDAKGRFCTHAGEGEFLPEFWFHPSHWMPLPPPPDTQEIE